MASQYKIQKANYDAYVKRPAYNPAVAREMWRQLRYANIVNPELSNEASKLLNASPTTKGIKG